MTVRLEALLLVLSAAGTFTGLARADGPTADACATASDNAQPLRNAGKLRAAKQQLLVCVNKSCPSIVRNDCATQLAEVEKAMPTVVFAATDPGGQDVSAVRVHMDGELLTDRLDGTALAADPGEHAFRFDADGFPPVNRKLVLHQAEKDRHVALTFRAPSRAGGGAPPPSDNGGARWPAYVAFGVGGAGLIAGIVFTALAIGQNSTLARECTLPGEGCNPKYQPDIDTLHFDQIVAGVGYGVAVVGAGLGTYFLLTSSSAPSESKGKEPAVRIFPRIGIGWLGVDGRFQ